MIFAAVTVYFVGLVNLYKTAHGRTVILPLASPAKIRTSSATLTLTLHQHLAYVVIQGLAEGRRDCCAFDDGQWDATNSTCTVAGLSGQDILLPGTGAFDDRGLDPIPKINRSPLCTAITGVDRKYLTDPDQYAVRLNVTHGTFGVCANKKAWVATLLTEPGRLSIGTTSVLLNDNASVWIVNSPSGGMTTTHEGEHFFWYYEMYEGAAACEDLPAAAASTKLCPGGIVFPGASGDLGCSNSTYP